MNMNSVNKPSSFELSRFNKSGNPLSPITNSASSSVVTSRRLIQARSTSTPLIKTPPWQNNGIVSSNTRSPSFQVSNHSPRYSLSTLSPPKPESHESPNRPTIQTVTGPLLASTRFNINLGTYTDVKSPGLTSRVVQYHNDLSGEQTSTHQTKYGSPGQFPIVQLYKKELPTLCRIPRRCTVRIAPPDPGSYNSEQANTILRESFVQHAPERNHMRGDSEISTRSVLEALKEISRKRIHAGDDLEDISNRDRTNSVNTEGHMHRKRMREDTPPKPKDQATASVISAPKRICVVNEIESSLSSSRLMRLEQQQQQGQKRKGALSVQENNKQRKIGSLVSRQTQTVTNDNNKPTEPPQKPISKKSTAAQTQTDKPTTHVIKDDIQKLMEASRNKKHRRKAGLERTLSEIDEENSTLNYNRAGTGLGQPIFDETPLEIIKQNKLAMMLSAFSGETPKIIPLPTITLSGLRKAQEAADALDGDSGKGIIGILSPKNKAKHDKHVTFSIPENGEHTTENSIVEATTTPVQNTISPFGDFATQQPQITLSPAINFSSGTAISNPVLPVSNSSPGGTIISFGPVTTTTVATSIISSTSVENTDKINTPTISFGGSNASFGTPKTPTFPGLGSAGQGGFSPPSSNVGAVNTSFNTPSNINVSTTISIKSAVNSSLFGGISNQTSVPTTTSAPAFSFGAPKTTPSTISFTPPHTSPGFTNLPAQLFNFAPLPKTVSSSPPFDAASQTTAPKMGGFKFDLGKTAPTPLPSPTEGAPPKANALGGTSKSGNFSFGSSNSSTPAFGITNNNPPPFGAPVVTAVPANPSIVFGTGSANTTGTPAAFGNPASSTTSTSNIFGAISTASTTMFGTPNSASINSTNSTPFGVPNSTSTTPSGGVFGSSSTSAFGTPSTTSNAFSTPSITNTNAFGTPSTTNSNAFGTPSTTNTSGVFGGTSNNTNAPAFAATTSTTPSLFGTPNTTATGISFGTPNTTAAPPAFGTVSTTSTPGSAFGAPHTNVTTPMFGGANSAFGAPKPEAPPVTPSFGGFGAAQNSSTAFGGFSSTPTTTQSTTAFGSGFGAAVTTQSSTFGGTVTTTNSFNFGGSTGATKTFSFGSTTPATTVGTGTTMFGSSTAPTTNLFANGNFGARLPATTTQSSFGQASGAFGTASTSSTFGNGSASAVFGGASGNNNNASSGFPSTGGVFGAASPPSGSAFGAPTTAAAPRNTYGGQNNYSAVAQPAGGMFGGAVNSNTSNTSFGTPTSTQNPPSFGAFGSPAVTQTQTAQPSSGVFSFGGVAPAPAPAAPSNTNNAFQFGTAPQTPKTGGFNFSGSTAAPNISFGGGATPSFSSPPASAFGAPQGQFGAPAATATGMFNIGSGSTAPKQRHMIKARRRN